MNKEINAGVNMYDFNRVNMGRLPFLTTKEEIEGAKAQVINYIEKTYNNYYMMLNHDKKDFTLFNFQNDYVDNFKILSMANDVIEGMENRGLGLLDINLDEAGYALEIWVKDKHTEAVFMYLLFSYDNGVIEY